MGSRRNGRKDANGKVDSAVEQNQCEASSCKLMTKGFKKADIKTHRT